MVVTWEEIDVAYEGYAARLGVEVEELTWVQQQQAFMNFIMEELKKHAEFKKLELGWNVINVEGEQDGG